MKTFRLMAWLGFGVMTWGMSLVWPEVNWALTPLAMLKLTLALGLVSLAYALGYYRRPDNCDKLESSNPAKQQHPSRPSRPVPPFSPA